MLKTHQTGMALTYIHVYKGLELILTELAIWASEAGI